MSKKSQTKKLKKLEEETDSRKQIESLERKLKKETDERKRLKRKVDEKEKTVREQEKRIDNLNQEKFSIPKSRKKFSGKGAYKRVIVPDTHGCHIERDASAAMLEDIKALKPKEVVLLGDHIDCGGFLAQHHVIGYVAETEYTFESDVAAANEFLDQIQESAKGAAFHYVEGNHERRIERHIVNQTLRNQADASFLRKLFGPESILHIERRGIHYYRQGTFYQNLPVPSTIKLGKCYFTHGQKSGKNAARTNLDQFGYNIVFGHVHKPMSATKRSIRHGVIGAWCPGALCRLQPYWRHTDITDWSHGYAIQFVDSSGEFLHVNVPIIEGKSYLPESL